MSRKIFLQLLIVALCSVFLTITVGQGQTAISTDISNSGVVAGARTIGLIEFSTDFEGVSWASGGDTTAGRLLLKDLNSQYYMYDYTTLEGGGSVFIDHGNARSDSPTPHGGSTFLGAQIPINPSGAVVRAQFDIKPQRTDATDPGLGLRPTPWINDTYYMSAWLYISPTWALNQKPSGDSYWASLCTIMNNQAGDSAWQFCLTVRPVAGSGYSGTLDPTTGYMLCIGSSTEDSNHQYSGGPVETTPATWNVSSIRGKWNHIEIYCHRGKGSWCTVWWNGVKILNAGGFPTLENIYTQAPSSDQNWIISFPKTYTDAITSQSNCEWVDDINLWNGMPY
jgi:hypothetical protein